MYTLYTYVDECKFIVLNKEQKYYMLFYDKSASICSRIRIFLVNTVTSLLPFCYLAVVKCVY